MGVYNFKGPEDQRGLSKADLVVAEVKGGEFILAK